MPGKKKKALKGVTANLPAKTDDRMEQLIDNLGIYRKWSDAALAAGYSETYSKNIEGRLRRNPAFMSKLTRRYGADASIARLPTLQRIRDKIYDEVEKNPLNEPKYKHVFKQDLQIAGVLSDNQPQQSTTINISGIRELMVQVGENRRRQLDGETADAEVIEEEDSE